MGSGKEPIYRHSSQTRTFACNVHPCSLAQVTAAHPSGFPRNFLFWEGLPWVHQSEMGAKLGCHVSIMWIFIPQHLSHAFVLAFLFSVSPACLPFLKVYMLSYGACFLSMQSSVWGNDRKEGNDISVSSHCTVISLLFRDLDCTHRQFSEVPERQKNPRAVFIWSNDHRLGTHFANSSVKNLKTSSYWVYTGWGKGRFTIICVEINT